MIFKTQFKKNDNTQAAEVQPCPAVEKVYFISQVVKQGKNIAHQQHEENLSEKRFSFLKLFF